jgi:predicted transcriptional regulator
MSSHIFVGCETFKSRLRELIEGHEDLSISEVGRRIGHKSGTNVSVLISRAKSGRADLRMSTFLKICDVLAEAYEGRISESEIALYLLGFPVGDMISSVKNRGFEYPYHEQAGVGGD